MDALGMIEVFGFVTAVCTADIAAKAADVKIIAFDNNKPAAGDSAEVPLVMIVKMEGSVDAVKAAVEAGKAYAQSKELYITSHIIPRPSDGAAAMAHLCSLGRDKIKQAKTVK